MAHDCWRLHVKELGEYVSDLTWPYLGQDCDEPRHERRQIDQAIGPRLKDHGREGTVVQALLKGYVAVDGDEDVAESFEPIEQIAIVDRGPTEVPHRGRVKADQVAQQHTWDAVIKHDAHAGRRLLTRYAAEA